MAIKKRGGTWHIDFQIGGQRIRETTGTSDRKLAQRIHDERKAREWAMVKLRHVPWEAAVVSYFNTRPETGSWSDDVQRINRLQPWLKDKFVHEIDRDTIRNIKTHLQTKDLKASTINRYLVVLRALLGHCVDEGWLTVAPPVKMLREGPGRLEYLTPDEVNKLLDALNEQVHKDFVVLAIATGLRMRNLTHLEWENVDMFRKTITVQASDYKSGRVHVVPINSMAMGVLKRLHRPSGRVLQYRGRDLDSIGRRAFKGAQKRAGIAKNVHPHIFRHTFASWNIMNGVSLPELKELGGWSKLESVMIYAHLNLDHLQEASEKIREALRV
jgi:integrase